jgi:hypothetical protein
MGTSSRFSTKREAIAMIVMIDGCMGDGVWYGCGEWGLYRTPDVYERGCLI